MLILTRKRQQTIVIGEETTVEVLAIGRTRVKIAIHAPRHRIVRRGELSPRPPAARAG